MAFNHEYPYVDMQMFNDDWLLHQMKELLKRFDDFVNLNKIKYANPILWDITSQYEANTIVIDPQTGDAYISVAAVPYGVSLSNTHYWTKIYNYSQSLNTLQEQIAAANEELSTTATAARTNGDLVWLNGYLFRVTADMIAGDQYVTGSNCEHVTIEEILNEIISDFEAVTGALDDLTTINKSNLVAAINELNAHIGDISQLQTTDKTSTVAAINELNTAIGDIIPLLNVAQVYETISDMCASEQDFEADDILVTVSPAYAAWKVKDSGEASLFVRQLANDKYVEFIATSEELNIRALGIGTEVNISDEFAEILAAGYKKIYIPKGHYYLAATITAGIMIRGDGRATSISPYNHTTAFTLNGGNIDMRDLTIQDVSPYTGNGLAVGADGCNNSHFENIHIENCTYAALITHSMIWDEFVNCNFYGSMSSGFVVTGSDFYFNDNLFLSCKFNNNVNKGLVLSLAEQKDYANTFIACNFEYNAQDRFGQTHTATCAIENSAYCSFYGCYFEGNGSENTDASILNYDRILLSGCVFINERYIVANNTAGNITGEATFISCKHLNLISGVSKYSNTKCVGINNSFDIEDGALTISLDDNKHQSKTYYNVTIDCDYPVAIQTHNAITTLTHAKNGQVIYIKAGSFNVAIAADLMLNATACTIPAGECYAFLVSSDKLIHIT